MTQWQPIETAPKDGSDMLVFSPEYREQFVVYWRKESQMWCYALQQDGSGAHLVDPTHWMPLPPAPEAA